MVLEAKYHEENWIQQKIERMYLITCIFSNLTFGAVNYSSYGFNLIYDMTLEQLVSDH